MYFTPSHRSEPKNRHKIPLFFRIFYINFMKFQSNLSFFARISMIFSGISRNLRSLFEIPPFPDVSHRFRFRRSSAGIWTRSVCCVLASSCARPAAALRDLELGSLLAEGRLLLLELRKRRRVRLHIPKNCAAVNRKQVANSQQCANSECSPCFRCALNSWLTRTHKGNLYGRERA